MEFKPALPESRPPPTPDGRRFAIRIAGITLAVFLLAVIFFLVFTSLSGYRVVWLTPAELARTTQPGPFTAFKQKVKNLMRPVWQRFRRTPPRIVINARLLTLTPVAVEQAGLGAPVTTNPGGIKAWILTPTESEALKQRISKHHGVSFSSSPSIMTVSGGQARLVSGEMLSLAGKPTPIGLTLDVQPKSSSHSIRMILSALATEKVGSPSNAVLVRTNLVVACHTTIPNDGSLVLDAGTQTNSEGKSHWIIVSPRLVDAQGKPLTR